MKCKPLPVSLLLCIWLAIFISDSAGIVRNEKVSEESVDAVNEYLEQHKLTCSDIICDNDLIRTILSYKEAVDAATSHLGNKASIIKPLVKDNLKSVQNDVEKLIDDVKHQIYQLRLKGRLTNDKVKQILEKAHNEVLQKKIMTEYEWKNVCRGLWSTYKPTKWYKRVLRSKPLVSQTNSKIDDLVQMISQHINPLGILSENQNSDIISLIRASIENKDYGKWTLTEWMEFLSNSIEEKTKLSKETLSQVTECIKDSLVEFKLNEIYSDHKLYNGAEQLIHWLVNELKNSTLTIKESLFHIDHTVVNASRWFDRMIHSSRWLIFVKKDLVTLYNSIKTVLGQMEINAAQSLNLHQQHKENESNNDSQQIKATSTLILGYPDIKLISKESTQKSSKAVPSEKIDTATTANGFEQEQKSYTKSLSEDIPDDYENEIQTVYPVPTKVPEAILYSKDNPLNNEFIDPWRENEQDLYRNLGYSETHVEWIKSYLERHFRNKKSTACGDIDEAARVIERYLSNIKIQSPCQIEKTIEILRKHLYKWRVTCDN